MSYSALFRHGLSRLDPERAHELAVLGVASLGRLPGARAGLRRRLAPDPCLTVEALGRRFPSPLGVAAGLDKNLTWFEELGALGFGFVEVGTVTALEQPGNPRPRVHRLTADRALINSMGFPNRGADAAAMRLAARTGETIVAVNVGRSKRADDAGADYRATVRRLAPLADFLVLNVSSPNTPGLRALQAVDALSELIGAVREELAHLGLSRPLLVKLAPDLTDADIERIAELALGLELDGIVATNTTISRRGLGAPAEVLQRPGGVSGAPLKARALEVLRLLAERTQGRLVLVSVGGIETAEDAWERIRAGATLLEAYTGFVYGGPLWPARLNRALAARVRAAGLDSIAAAVGGPAAELAQ